METNLRQAPRRISKAIYDICWQDEAGLTKSAEVEGIDVSDLGISFKSLVELHPGTNVFIQGPDDHPRGHGVVRHCIRRDLSYVVGLELDEEARKTVARPDASVADYYELLQISPKADRDTIHRVAKGPVQHAARITRTTRKRAILRSLSCYNVPLTFCPTRSAAPRTIWPGKWRRLNQPRCPRQSILWMASRAR